MKEHDKKARENRETGQNNRQLLSFLFSLLKPSRWLLVATVLLSASTILANVGLLGVSAVLISLAALQPPLLDLMVYIVGVRFFGISRALLRYTERYLSHKMTFDILTRLRINVYQRMEPVAPAGLQKYSQGQLFDRLLHDIEVLKYFYLRAVLTPAAALLVLAVCSLVLAQFHVGVALLLVVLFVLFGLVLPVAMAVWAKGRNLQLSRYREVWQTMLEDYLGGLGELYHTSRQQQFGQQLQQQMTVMAGLERRLAVLSSITTSLLQYGSHLSLVLALLLVIPAVQQGSLSGVYCAMVLLIVWSSFEAILPFPQALLQLQQSMEAARHVTSLPMQEGRQQQGPVPDSYDLEVQHVAFGYEEGTQVYHNLSLQCPQGSHIALVGASGSGKSTLASLLVGFWQPQQGQILLGGRPLTDYGPEQLRSWIGVAEQQTFLFSATIRENLQLAKPEATEAELQQALAFAVLEDVVTALPQGMDTYIGENGYRLSGGQRQRLALARVWLQNHPVVILDEVYQGLDGLTAQRLRRQLQQWSQGRTVIEITHSMQHLQQMDAVYVLQRGVIVEHGTAEQLLRQKDSVFAQMWQLERQQMAAL